MALFIIINFLSFFFFFLCVILMIKGCKDVGKEEKLLLYDSSSQLLLHGNEIVLKENDEHFLLDPYSLSRTKMEVSEALINDKKVPINNVKEFCKPPCQVQCRNIDSNTELCGFTGILHGCPIMSIRENLVSEPARFRSLSTPACNESVPLVYIHRKNRVSRKIYYSLLCGSSEWSSLHFFDQLDIMKIDSTSRQLFVLMSLKVSLSTTIYGICSFDINEIIKTLEDFEENPNSYDFSSGVIYKNRSSWEKLQKNELNSIRPGILNGAVKTILLNRKPKPALLNYRLNDYETFMHYTVSKTEDLSGTQYDMHIIASNRGKIIKGITNEHVNLTMDLWCKLENIRTIDIWNREKILVLTSSFFYLLPIARCKDFTSCTRCIELRDPLCSWRENKSCINILNMTRKHDEDRNTEMNNSSLKQDIKHGDTIDQCGRKSFEEHSKHEMNKIMEQLEEIKRTTNKTIMEITKNAEKEIPVFNNSLEDKTKERQIKNDSETVQILDLTKNWQDSDSDHIRQQISTVRILVVIMFTILILLLLIVIIAVYKTSLIWREASKKRHMRPFDSYFDLSEKQGNDDINDYKTLTISKYSSRKSSLTVLSSNKTNEYTEMPLSCAENLTQIERPYPKTSNPCREDKIEVEQFSYL